MFLPYLDRWALVADGELVRTANSDLLPVTCRGLKAMLKVARAAEEQRGNRLMAWWSGWGSAPVLAQEGDAVLMARADRGRSLADLALGGCDDESSRILCEVAGCLHSCEGMPPFRLIPLAEWFQPLVDREADGLIGLAAATARSLLGSQEEVVVLHGDIHHRNVLHFGERGWLAVDPKGLEGERAFDLVNILRNPNPELALAPGRLARQASIIAAAGKVDRDRLLQWLLAFSGLSAVWLMEEDETPELDVGMGRLAAAELGLAQ